MFYIKINSGHNLHILICERLSGGCCIFKGICFVFHHSHRFSASHSVKKVSIKIMSWQIMTMLHETLSSWTLLYAHYNWLPKSLGEGYFAGCECEKTGLRSIWSLNFEGVGISFSCICFLFLLNHLGCSLLLAIKISRKWMCFFGGNFRNYGEIGKMHSFTELTRELTH